MKLLEFAHRRWLLLLVSTLVIAVVVLMLFGNKSVLSDISTSAEQHSQPTNQSTSIPAPTSSAEAPNATAPEQSAAPSPSQTAAASGGEASGRNSVCDSIAAVTIDSRNPGSVVDAFTQIIEANSDTEIARLLHTLAANLSAGADGQSIQQSAAAVTEYCRTNG